MNLKETLQLLIQNNEEIYSKIMKVTAVDLSTYTCTCIDVGTDLEYYNIRLQKHFISIPLVNSYVIVSFLDKENAFVSLIEEVDTYIIKNNDVDLKNILSDLLSALKALTVTTNMGASGTPINIQDFIAVENNLKKFFKQ